MTRRRSAWQQWKQIRPIPGAVLVITALVVLWIALVGTH